MPYTVKHDPALDIIEVTVTGVIGERDTKDMTSNAIGLQKQKGTTRFLLDIDGWDGGGSFFDIYDLANTQYREEELHGQSRIAVILPTSAHAKEALRFYETVCYNRGWNVRVCSDRQEAIDWLRAAPSASGERVV